MNYKEILAIVGILIGFISYGVYFKGIFLGKTKPHTFSWLIWAIGNTTTFFAQISKDAGPGAWITAANGICCWLVVLLSLKFGEKNITKSDWVCLCFALSGIVGWGITKNPLTAVVFACVADIFAIIPTFRKSYLKPFEENPLSFGIDLVKFTLELFALKTFSLVTALFPITILVNDIALVIMILIRRRMVKKNL